MIVIGTCWRNGKVAFFAVVRGRCSMRSYSGPYGLIEALAEAYSAENEILAREFFAIQKRLIDAWLDEARNYVKITEENEYAILIFLRNTGVSYGYTYALENVALNELMEPQVEFATASDAVSEIEDRLAAQEAEESIDSEGVYASPDPNDPLKK